MAHLIETIASKWMINMPNTNPLLDVSPLPSLESHNDIELHEN